VVEPVPQRKQGKARDKAGEVFGVSGRSVAAAKAINYHAEEAKKRQQATLPSKGEKGFNVPEPVPGHSKGEARDKAGEVFGVSGRSVAGAKFIPKRTKPEDGSL
jgi:hypothetical protein